MNSIQDVDSEYFEIILKNIKYIYATSRPIPVGFLRNCVIVRNDIDNSVIEHMDASGASWSGLAGSLLREAYNRHFLDQGQDGVVRRGSAVGQKSKMHGRELFNKIEMLNSNLGKSKKESEHDS